MTDLLIYAIGDIHGHRKILDDLLDRIEKDAGGRPYMLVFLGDYVDRGPDSKGVLDRMVELQSRDWQHKPVFLMGNHEEKLLGLINPKSRDFLLRRRPGKKLYNDFMTFGGLETFESYNVGTNMGAHFEVAAALKEAMPVAHRTFLESLTLSFQTQTHFFCHAGVDFSKPLHRQSQRDLLWSRGKFLASKAEAEKIIVHGHTITYDFKPKVRHNRIGIDTGAYDSGILTACVLDGALAPRFVMTSPR